MCFFFGGRGGGEGATTSWRFVPPCSGMGSRHALRNIHFLPRVPATHPPPRTPRGRSIIAERAWLRVPIDQPAPGEDAATAARLRDTRRGGSRGVEGVHHSSDSKPRTGCTLGRRGGTSLQTARDVKARDSSEKLRPDQAGLVDDVAITVHDCRTPCWGPNPATDTE